MPKKNPSTGDPILDTLKAERERRGLSQTEVAQSIGRSTYQTTYQWESGASSPTLRCLREWAASLGYDVTLTPADTPAPGRAVIVSDGRGGKTIAEEHDVDLPRGPAAAIRRSDRQPTRAGLPVDGEERK